MKHEFESPELRAWADPYWGGIKLLLRREDSTGQYVGMPVTMLKLRKEDEGVSMPATLELGPGRAQLLMDDLWRCGLRPSEGTGSAGALAATQAHLKDMQTLTFKLLEKGTV